LHEFTLVNVVAKAQQLDNAFEVSNLYRTFDVDNVADDGGGHNEFALFSDYERNIGHIGRF